MAGLGTLFVLTIRHWRGKSIELIQNNPGNEITYRYIAAKTAVADCSMPGMNEAFYLSGYLNSHYIQIVMAKQNIISKVADIYCGGS